MNGDTKQWNDSCSIAVVGIFPDRQTAEKAVRSLTDAGFPLADLTVAGQEEVGAAVAEGRLGLPKRAEIGLEGHDTAWGLMGGILMGVLLGAEAAAFAGLSGVVLLGSLAVATAVGAVSGAVYGEGLAGTDISEIATELREEIRAGRVLVAARTQKHAVVQIRGVMASTDAVKVREQPFIQPAEKA